MYLGRARDEVLNNKFLGRNPSRFRGFREGFWILGIGTVAATCLYYREQKILEGGEIVYLEHDVVWRSG